MRRLIQTLTCAAALGLAAPAAAQLPEDARPFHNVEYEDLQDARYDLRRIEAIHDLWNEAVSLGNPINERVADQRLRRWLREEIREDRRDIEDARREIRIGRQQLRQTGSADAHADYADEQTDERAALRDLHVTRRLAHRFDELQPAFREERASPRDYDQKRAILRRLVRQAHREYRRAERETEEDREEWLETIER